MRKKLVLVAAFVVAAAAIPHASTAVAPSPAAIVFLNQSRFCSPTPLCNANQNVTVARGGTVVWVFADPLCAAFFVAGCDHTVTSGNLTPDGKFNSGSMIGGARPVFSHTFTTAGTHTYYCIVHGVSMKANVVVA